MYSALSGSTVDTCRLQFTRLLGEFLAFSSFWWTPGDDFMFVSVFSAELGSSADTCTASVYGAFCAQLQFIMVVVIPVITQRQFPMVLVTQEFLLLLYIW